MNIRTRIDRIERAARRLRQIEAERETVFRFYLGGDPEIKAAEARGEKILRFAYGDNGSGQEGA